MSTRIVRSQTPEEDELANKLAELSELEMELAERELQLATLTSELHSFEQRYLQIVGARYAQLDELHAQIAEARLRQTPDEPRAKQSAAKARARARESAESAEEAMERSPSPVFQPSEALKRLYRKVARAVHPDLASDEDQRVRRTRLMAATNRAYE